ncbi:glutamyl-tRNA synthetase [Amylocarpus encephaloides]|uniref:Glutamate--tRNA ligase, mitochondrial n=1 Tax=Amylocarpus encephaloides TaxID=45428 RepID=A0A9P7YMN9_9HELO|nr:glutamyl-tRNA synthetase [Amylocarpus encephaloides]
MLLFSRAGKTIHAIKKLRFVRCIHDPIRTTPPSKHTPDKLRAAGPARTRFAPSPTGHIHLGSLRTALFNYVVAKATGGQFLLRIEDTDQKRTIPGAEERILKDLEWAGIVPDEGPGIGGPYGPYRQSERTDTYRNHAEQLLKTGHAYRCFCTPQRMLELAEFRAKSGQASAYDRRCLHVSQEESDDKASQGFEHTIRLKSPTRYPAYFDFVYGPQKPGKSLDLITRNGSIAAASGFYEDPILLKSDGFPTYHLANIVDDHLMKITHVIRGSEWISSTPKHVFMYEAFGWEPPQFGHVSLLTDMSGQKLSKRTGSTEILTMREEMGIFPETLSNFVALLGWSHGLKRDVMGMQDLIENASLKFTKGDTKVSFEKLWYLQKKHALRYSVEETEPTKSSPSNPRQNLRKLATESLMELLKKKLDDPSYEHRISHRFSKLTPNVQKEKIHQLVLSDAQNYTNPSEFLERHMSLLYGPTKDLLTTKPYPLQLHHLPKDVDSRVHTESVTMANLAISVSDFTLPTLKESIETYIRESEERSLSQNTDDKSRVAIYRKAWTKFIYGYYRWALTGGAPGPDIAVIMMILGKQETVGRLDYAANVLTSSV